MRDFAAVTGYAPRAARGAQWRVLSGSKTRHIIHLRGEVKGDKVQCTACACVMKNAFFTASLWHWNRHVQRKHTNHVQPEQEVDCGENQASPVPITVLGGKAFDLFADQREEGLDYEHHPKVMKPIQPTL